MSGTCSRCGRTGEMDYGTDGQAYCSACSFYGLNKQCGRCRMYLPATELQSYRGMFVCPYCIQDMRDEDRRVSERPVERPRLEVLQYPETCERCGRDLEGRVYVWNGKKLCKSCLNHEQDTWGIARGGPMGPAQRIRVDTVHRAERLSFIERAMGDFLMLLGLKKKPISEIVIYHPKMQGEIRAAKPMAEAMAGKAKPAEKTDKKPSPIEVEGIMDSEKKKGASKAPPSLEFETPLSEPDEIVPKGQGSGPLNSAASGMRPGKKPKKSAALPRRKKKQ
jgi:hypothetical protein